MSEIFRSSGTLPVLNLLRNDVGDFTIRGAIGQVIPGFKSSMPVIFLEHKFNEKAFIVSSSS